MNRELREEHHPSTLDVLLKQARDQAWSGCLKATHPVWKNPLLMDLQGGLLESVQFRSQVFTELPSTVEGLKGWAYVLYTNPHEIMNQKFNSLRELGSVTPPKSQVYELLNGKVEGASHEKAESLKCDLHYFSQHALMLAGLFHEKSFQGFVCREEGNTVVFKKRTPAGESGSNINEGDFIESNDPFYYGDEAFTGEKE